MFLIYQSIEECAREIKERTNVLKTVGNFRNELMGMLKEGITLMECHVDERVRETLLYASEQLWTYNTELAIETAKKSSIPLSFE